MLSRAILMAICFGLVALQCLPLVCLSENLLSARIVFITLSFFFAILLLIKPPQAAYISYIIAFSSIFFNITGFICLRAYQQSKYDSADDFLTINQTESDLESNLKFFFGFLNGICLAPGITKIHQVATLSFGILLWSFQSRDILTVLISVSFILEALVIIYLIHLEELAVSKQPQQQEQTMTSLPTSQHSPQDSSFLEEYEWMKQFIQKSAPLNLIIFSDKLHVVYSTQHFYKVMGVEHETDIWNFLQTVRVEAQNQNLFDLLYQRMEDWNKEKNNFGQISIFQHCEIELEKYCLIVGECTLGKHKCLVFLANSENDISTFNQYTHKMINAISHDLKTPLNAIILLLDILKDQIKNRQAHQTSPSLRVNHSTASPVVLKKSVTSHRNSVKDSQFIDPFFHLGQKSVSLRYEQEEQSRLGDNRNTLELHSPLNETLKQDPFSQVSGILIPLQEEDEEEEDLDQENIKNQASEEWLKKSQKQAASRNHLYHENTNSSSSYGTKHTVSQTMSPMNPAGNLNKILNKRLSSSNFNKKIQLYVDCHKPINHHNSQNIQSLVQIKEDEESSLQTQNSSLAFPPLIRHLSGQSTQKTHSAAYQRNQKRHKSRSTPGSTHIPKSTPTNDKDINPSGQTYQEIPRDIEIESSEKQIQQTQTNTQQQVLTLDLQKISRLPSIGMEHKSISSSPPKKSRRRSSQLSSLQHHQDQARNKLREQNDIKILFSYISSIEKNGQLLESRINDLIDYSTLLSKKELSLTCTQFDLMDVLLEMDDLFGVQARQKKLLLLLPQNNIKMKNDKPRIKQVLINIIGNAIKFTFEGFVRITVTTIETEKELLEISVQDTGIGISDLILGNLFSFTDHLRQVKDDHRQGVGIGLEICSRLCQIIGPSNQQLIVSSQINSGSKFSFRVFIDHPLYNEERDLSSAVPKSRKKKALRGGNNLNTQNSFRSENEHDDQTNHISIPCFTTNRSLMSRENLEDKHHSDQKKLSVKVIKGDNVSGEENEEEDEEESEEETVLIVDDVAFNLIALRNTLKLIYPHLKVIEALNGKQAVEKVRENNGLIDLVIMDINMPIMDGFQAMQIINDEIKDKKLEYVPIIAHTAFDNNDDKQKCFSLGAKGFLPKPVKRIELQRATQPYLSEKAFQPL